MNSIFKSSLGFHIDLSKIVFINDTFKSTSLKFEIIISSHNEPIAVHGLIKNEISFEEDKKQLIDAWIRYQDRDNALIDARLLKKSGNESQIPCTGTNPLDGRPYTT